MRFLASDLIGKAKAQIDTDEVAVKNWIPDSAWLAWIDEAVIDAYRSDLIAGTLQFEPKTDTVNAAVSLQPWPVHFTGEEFTEPLVVFGVTEETGNTRRVLRPVQPGDGRVIMPGVSNRTGPGQRWWAYHRYDGGAAGEASVIVRTDPVPTSGTYVVYSLPRPATMETPLSVVELTPGQLSYVVLCMARNALGRMNSRSPFLEDRYQERRMQMDVAVALGLQNAGARVRNTDRENRGWQRRGQDVGGDIWDPASWWWSL